MPAAQGHKCLLVKYDAETEPFLSVNWIHRFGNENDLAFAGSEAEEIRAEAIKRKRSIKALKELHDRSFEEFSTFIFEVVEDTAALGRLLEFTEADKLEQNPNRIVIDL